MYHGNSDSSSSSLPSSYPTDNHGRSCNGSRFHSNQFDSQFDSSQSTIEKSKSGQAKSEQAKSGQPHLNGVKQLDWFTQCKHLASASAVASLLLLTIGCSENKPLKPELSLQVSGGGDGTYTVQGQTNLPNPKVGGQEKPLRVTVQAIRRFRPRSNARRLINTQPIYAVVAKQQVDVSKGTWETRLNLNQPNGKGLPQEVWQLNQAQFPLEFEPEQTVLFLATTAPLDRSLKLDKKLGSGENGNSLLQVGSDGSVYLQAEKTMTIAPPPLQKATIATNPQVVKVVAQSLREAVKEKQDSSSLPSSAFLK
ncbi:MAG: hypothetical protein B0A82_15085 [Alkalinema sp. CACIAM 70d]|nr:MAG: hypothetical protein B0A82_15085 [Alkalinema sp. CACIAM 70d]